MNILSITAFILVMALFLMATKEWGNILKKIFFKKFQSLQNDSKIFPSLSQAIGLMLFSAFISILVFFKLLTNTTFLLVALLTIIPLLLKAKHVKLSANGIFGFLRNNYVFILLFITLPILVLPPFSRDALVYHLEVPRQIIAHQGFPYGTSNIYAYLPLGTEMLYLFFLKFFPPFSVRILHFTFLILTIKALIEYFKIISNKKVSSLLALPVFLAFLTVPKLFLCSAEAYIDTSLMFYSVVILLGINLVLNDFKISTGALFFLIGGLLSIKIISIYILLIIIMAFFIILLTRKLKLTFEYKSIILFFFGFIFISMPFFIKNLLFTHNPLFPFMSSVLKPQVSFWSHAQETALHGLLNHFGNCLYHHYLYPLNYFVASINTKWDNFALFDGVLGPFLLLWLPIPFLKKEVRGKNLFLLIVLTLYCLIWSVFFRQARFIFPTLPLIAIIVFDYLSEIGKNSLRRNIFLFFLFVTICFNLFSIFNKIGDLVSFKYLAGKETKTGYLEKHLPVFSCQNYININTPKNANIFLLQTGNENFYLNRNYISDYVVEDFTFHNWISGSLSINDLWAKFVHRRIYYLLIRENLVFEPALYADLQGKFPLVISFFQNRCTLLYRKNGFAVYKLNLKR